MESYSGRIDLLGEISSGRTRVAKLADYLPLSIIAIAHRLRGICQYDCLFIRSMDNEIQGLLLLSGRGEQSEEEDVMNLR